jgi:cytochrome c oxidase subunit 2
LSVQRRRINLTALALVLAGVGTVCRSERGEVRRIAVVARKFAFSTTEILAHAGESITLELSSVDFVHGFALPELGVRVDVPPGRKVELSLPPLRVGRYSFLCDNFCGEAHDKMTGALVVLPRPGAA